MKSRTGAVMEWLLIADSRPNWFVDAKWITAHLFVVIFSVTLLVNDAAVATSERGVVTALRAAAERTYGELRAEFKALIERYQGELRKLPSAADPIHELGAELGRLQDSQRELVSQLQTLETNVDTLATEVYGVAAKINLIKRNLGLIEGRLQSLQLDGDALEQETASLVQQHMNAFFVEVRSLTGIQFVLSMHELQRLSAEQIVERFLQQAAGQLYHHGLQHIHRLEQELDVDLQPLQAVTFYSPQTHRRIKMLRAALWVVSTLLLVLLIGCSAGLGRLVSPGLVLIIVALPGFVLFSELGAALHRIQPQLATDNEMLGAFAAALGRLLDREFVLLSEWHGVALGLGCALVTIALLIKISAKRAKA